MIRLLLALLVLAVAPAAVATNIVIINQDGPNEGLNDPAPRAPVGGNPGDTLGEQRMNALQYAARILESRLVSTVPMRIGVNFKELDCDFNNALIGKGGATFLVSNFPHAPMPDTLYPIALANALAGRRLDVAAARPYKGGSGYVDIAVTLTSAIDSPQHSNCIGGGGWYYGFDGQTPAGDLNFLNTVIHEIIHGLGFQTFVDLQTGRFYPGPRGKRMPDIYSAHIMALSLPGNPLWPEMTAKQRIDSANDRGTLVWDPIVPGSGAGSTTANAVSRLNNGVNSGRVQLYAPCAIQIGSSVSHLAAVVSPDQIMEPFANDSEVTDGLGLSLCMLRDMGWRLAGGSRCWDDRAVPAPDFRRLGHVSGAGCGTDGNITDVSSDGTTNGGGSNDSGSTGGGCTVTPGAPFNPLFPSVVFAAVAALVWRRRYGS